MLPVVLENLEQYMSRPYPLPEINLVALPGYTDDKPIDAWGLQMFREVDLCKKRDEFWVAHILAKYASLQWTDHLTTPIVLTVITQALAKFLADKVAWQVKLYYNVYGDYLNNNILNSNGILVGETGVQFICE